MKALRYIMALLFIALLISCQSGKPVRRLSDDGFMFAMIYDQSGSPVSGATVYLNGRRTVVSDIQGRFVLESMKRGSYKILLVKSGYEILEEEFQYLPMQVLYLKMTNTAALIELAENALDRRDLGEAEHYIERALAVEPMRPDIEFLSAIVYYLQGRLDRAAEVLGGMIARGSADRSVFRLLENIRSIQESGGDL